MKLILLALLCPLLAMAEPVGVVYKAVINRIIDGDTIVIQAPYLPKPLKPEIAVRIYGVDTPEKASEPSAPKKMPVAMQPLISQLPPLNRQLSFRCQFWSGTSTVEGCLATSF